MFVPAWATWRVDLEALWAKGDEKGNEKADQKVHEHELHIQCEA